ncbi:MAG: nucleotidyltransferase family protein [Alphaproteobacteria bacterium]|uniref:Nucleotidyltransferase family protein n=1 Tax=Candidatus Nitrobium versatile TaxID=2884831 RepID=A0A953JFK5_9BACT|nr:nucleotidyltransferase family protein [Candidatus Nitrobium versatile]
MKALILAGGRGRRMEELSEDRNKCLISLRGKPLVEYSLEAASSIPRIGEIVLLVGYQAESIINHYGISFNGKRIRYRIQHERRGLVSAIETALPDLDGEDFFLFLGDEVILNGRYDEMIDTFYRENAFVVCGVLRQKDPEQIRKTYAIIQSESGIVYRLIEKPERAVNDIMGTGNCIFRNGILSYIPKVPLHHIRNEKELPDLIQCAIDDGRMVRSFFISEHYINVNTKTELESMERSWPEIPSPHRVCRA